MDTKEKSQFKEEEKFFGGSIVKTRSQVISEYPGALGAKDVQTVEKVNKAVVTEPEKVDSAKK